MQLFFLRIVEICTIVIICKLRVNILGDKIMGTFFKYVFYAILLVVLYLVGKGIYDGAINEQTTVGAVMEQVGDGGKQMAKDGVKAVDNAVNGIEKKSE